MLEDAEASKGNCFGSRKIDRKGLWASLVRLFACGGARYSPLFWLVQVSLKVSTHSVATPLYPARSLSVILLKPKVPFLAGEV